MNDIQTGTVISLNADGTCNVLAEGQIYTGIRGDFPSIGATVLFGKQQVPSHPPTPKISSSAASPGAYVDDFPGVLASANFDAFEISRVVVDGEDDGSAYKGSLIEIEGEGLDETKEVWFPVEDFEHNYTDYPPPSYTTRTVVDGSDTYRIANFTNYVVSKQEDKVTLVLPDIGVGNYGVCGLLSGHAHLFSEDDEEAVSPDGVQVHHIYEVRPRLYISVEGYGLDYIGATSLEVDSMLPYLDIKDEIEINAVKNSSQNGPKIVFKARTILNRISAVQVRVEVLFDATVTDIQNNLTVFNSPNPAIVDLERVDADYTIFTNWKEIRTGPPPSIPSDHVYPAVTIEMSDRTTIVDLDVPPDNQRLTLLQVAQTSSRDTRLSKFYGQVSTPIKSGNIAVPCDNKSPQPIGNNPDTQGTNYTTYVLHTRITGVNVATMWHLNNRPIAIQAWVGIWPPNTLSSTIDQQHLRLINNANESYQANHWLEGFLYEELREENFVSFIDFYRRIAVPEGGAELKISGAVGVREEPAYVGDLVNPPGTSYSIGITVTVWRVVNPGQSNESEIEVFNTYPSGIPLTSLRNGQKKLAATIFLP